MNAAAMQALERALLAVGVALGGWSMLGALERDYHASLGVRRATAVEATTPLRELPGDGASSRSPAPPAPVEPGTLVARLEAPRTRFSASVLEGSTDDVLARAAGHIEGTPLPGAGGNVGIAGHRDTTFRPLRDIEKGDLLRVTTAKGLFEYRVVRAWVVRPRDVYVLDPTAQPSLTLVTCYPFRFVGPAPLRYVIRAELVEPNGPSAATAR